MFDVADNAGGGGRANTVWILKAFHGTRHRLYAGDLLRPFAGRQGASAGRRRAIQAVFNREETHKLSGHFSAGQPSRSCTISRSSVVAVSPPVMRSVLARVRGCASGGIDVIVVSVRQQTKDPVFMEALGVDIRQQRSLIVSRATLPRLGGQFLRRHRSSRVDVPGLTTPVLKNVPYRYVPRQSIRWMMIGVGRSGGASGLRGEVAPEARQLYMLPWLRSRAVPQVLQSIRQKRKARLRQQAGL